MVASASNFVIKSSKISVVVFWGLLQKNEPCFGTFLLYWLIHVREKARISSEAWDIKCFACLEKLKHFQKIETFTAMWEKDTYLTAQIQCQYTLKCRMTFLVWVCLFLFSVNQTCTTHTRVVWKVRGQFRLWTDYSHDTSDTFQI